MVYFEQDADIYGQSDNYESSFLFREKTMIGSIELVPQLVNNQSKFQKGEVYLTTVKDNRIIASPTFPMSHISYQFGKQDSM